MEQVVEIDNKAGICRIEGVDYPIVGFGTYPLTGKVCAKAVKEAIKAGYRILDTATLYANFDAIASALKGHERSHFYLMSKVWHNMQSPQNVHKDLNETLKQLQTDYIDAYFVHWPNHQIPIEGTLGAMEDLRQAKKIRHIGLSNVTVNHLKRALEAGITITWVQIEMHPHFYDRALLDFCHERSIAIQAWRPLDLGRINDDQVLKEVGEKYGKSPCQVALRWITQHECIPLPGSKNKAHIRENLDIIDFVLSSEDMEKLDQRAQAGTRYRLREGRGLGFTDEFDFSYEECWPK